MMHKVGSIPFKVFKDKFAILFVTSQVRGRWILPKGTLLEGESHETACNRSTFEEAGVKGKLIKNFPITKLITKSINNGTTLVPVTFYPLLVENQFDDWPDKGTRQRHWSLLRDVNKVASREDYLNVLDDFKSFDSFILI